MENFFGSIQQQSEIVTTLLRYNLLGHSSSAIAVQSAEALTSANLEDNRKLLCLFKSHSQEGFGGLNVPSSCYLEYIIHLEDHFVKHFTTKLQKVGASVLKTLKTTPVPFQSCPEFLLEFLLKLFLTMRIYHRIKFANREFSSNKKNHENTLKLHIFDHNNIPKRSKRELEVNK